MTVCLDVNLTDKQREFFDLDAKFCAYGGSRGGGKSWALRIKLLLLCLNYSGIRVLLLRKTYAQLYENHVLPLQKIINPLNCAKYSNTEKCFCFKNGSILKCGYLACDSDLLQYQGQEFDVIAIDEATHFSYHQFLFLTASLRGTNDFPKRMYLSCNPGGVGHAWVKRLFIDREFRDCENPNDYAFIKARVYDNGPLLEKNPDYIKQLENLSPDLKEAWLNGNWNTFSGQFFPEFSYSAHTVAPIEIPDNAVRYCAIDYGLDMLAAVYVAVCDDGYAYVYDEIHIPDLIVSKAAAELKNHDRSGIIYIAPSDLASRQKDTGKSIIDIFAENGVYFDILHSSRIDGWLSLKEWMCVENGEAKLKIFSSCKNLLRCIPLLLHDEKIKGDAATEPHAITHITDALRYFASYRTFVPRKNQKLTFEKRIKRK